MADFGTKSGFKVDMKKNYLEIYPNDEFEYNSRCFFVYGLCTPNLNWESCRHLILSSNMSSTDQIRLRKIDETYSPANTELQKEFTSQRRGRMYKLFFATRVKE